MRKCDRFFFISGLLMAASEIWKQWCLTVLLNHGSYNWWYFPFQLCSLPMYLCLLLPLLPSVRYRNASLTFLMDYSLLSGIFAFFDTSGMHYSYPPLTFHSYAWHILLIVMGLTAGLSNEVEYTWKEFKDSTLFYLGGCFIATACNILFHPLGTINMFYISPYSPMEQRVFRQVADLLGNGWGILIYLAAIPFGAFLFHLLWKIFHYRIISSLT